MKITQLAVVSLFTAGALVTGCKKKDDAATDKAAKPTEAQPSDKAADTKPAETKPTEAAPEAKAAPAELVEHDLSAFGPQFKGVVVMAPKTAKIEFDDPSRHIVLSDVDFVSISEAPYWEDGVKSLAKDPDNKNIRKVSETEYRYERTPPLGTAHAVEVMVKLGKDKFSCTAGDPGTFSGAAMADQISAICNSIKKK